MFQLCIIPQLELLRYAKIIKSICFIQHLIFISYRSKAIRDEIEGVTEAHLSQSPVPDEIEQPPMNEVERREKVNEKFKYLCVAFDGDHPQIVATESKRPCCFDRRTGGGKKTENCIR